MGKLCFSGQKALILFGATLVWAGAAQADDAEPGCRLSRTNLIQSATFSLA